MIRLRHANNIMDKEANEIILLNSHDGSSSYQMMAGMFRFVCQWPGPGRLLDGSESTPQRSR
jgi:hypothetical protein